MIIDGKKEAEIIRSEIKKEIIQIIKKTTIYDTKLIYLY